MKSEYELEEARGIKIQCRYAESIAFAFVSGLDQTIDAYYEGKRSVDVRQRNTIVKDVFVVGFIPRTRFFFWRKVSMPLYCPRGVPH